MLVPRSFKYSSSPPSESKPKKLHDNRPKSGRLFSDPVWSSPLAVSNQNRPDSMIESYPAVVSPASTKSTNMRQPSQPVEIPSPRSSGEFQTPKAARTRGQHATRKSRRSDDAHRSDAIPPAVAALLAVTAIPPPRNTQSRRKRTSSSSRRISIDELVQEWRNDSSLRRSLDSSTSLSLLLESAEESYDGRPSYSRSSSCESIPSLEGDDHSVMSIGSPATPESLRSQRSTSITPRKGKHMCAIATEDCSLEHPLGLSGEDMYEEAGLLSVPPPKHEGNRRRKPSSFKSNLTSSLQSLKSRALSSISSLNQAITQTDAAFSDETLWQHPFLFPRLSSEVRPRTFSSIPTRSERRYFNPTPVSFEEQQHHWSKALGNLNEEDVNTPMIQMQTYRRSAPSATRKSRRNSGTPDPRSEAGRVLAAPLGAPQLARQREVRENSDFLRVIVLEMNMRRKGKLEEGTAGKARIWLPPRRPAMPNEDVFEEEGLDDELVEGTNGRRVPKRWVGVSADD